MVAWGFVALKRSDVLSIDTPPTLFQSHPRLQASWMGMTKTDSAKVAVLPWPRQVNVGSGSLQLSHAVFETSYRKSTSPRIAEAVQRFFDEVTALTRGATAAAGSVAPGDPPMTTIMLCITCESPGEEFPGLDEDESYWLVVDDAGIYIDAACDRGVLHALTTLIQLVQVDGVVPFVAIDDAPRLPWRGLLLDVARHFLDPDSLSRTLSGMAMCKLNVLHLHLSDDQAFRLPSLAYPKLASEPAYTREELRSLVAQAALLGIRVVPEIDMPGHVTSWLTAYPEWGTRVTSVSRRFGVHPGCLDPTNEAVYSAIGRLLDEICEIFPDRCLHIGGDEVHAQWWSDDPAIAAFQKTNGIEDIAGVQAHFNRRVGAMVADRDRTVVAWDEVLYPSLNTDWIVQCWRGGTMRDRARANGNRTLMSAHYYLDLNYPVDVHYQFDPLAAQQVLLEREDAMLDDPRFASVAAGLRWSQHWREGAIELATAVATTATSGAAQSAAVLGGEACLWGELVDAQLLDVRLWSRLPAVAEKFWSPANRQDLAAFYHRFERYLEQIHPLRGYAIYERSHQQLRQLGIGEQWLPLVDMLEPLKWYARLLGEQALAARVNGREMPRSRPYDADTPLTGVADYLPPESVLARRVDDLCASQVVGDEQSATELANLAQQWIALAKTSAPPALEAVAQACGELGGLVIQRLHGPPQTHWTQLLLDVTAHRGELMLAVGPELRRWLLGDGV